MLSIIEKFLKLLKIITLDESDVILESFEQNVKNKVLIVLIISKLMTVFN